MSRALRSQSGCCACACASVPETAPEDGEHCCDLCRTASDEASTRYAESEAGASTATPSSWCRPTSSAASVCSDALDEACHLEEDFQGPPAVHQQASASRVVRGLTSKLVYYVGSFLLTDASAPQPPPSRQESCESLQASASSWVAQRRSRLQGTAMDRNQRVACLVKSTMNKLTAENLPRLSQQLAQCIETEMHMQRLVSTVFEAASAQHTFIEMYADLAVVLHKYFEQRRVTDGAGRPISFKRLLILECSQALAASSQQPADAETAMKYKDQSLGSMKLVGALCARRLLASSVFLSVSEHLLSADTAEMLESLAALLTIAGPVFDSPDFEQKELLEGLFASLKDIAGATTMHDTRTRCLLSDVLDLRANGWQKKSGQQ